MRFPGERLQEDCSSGDGAELPGNWGAFLDEQPALEPPQESLGACWDFQTHEEEFGEHRGLVAIEGGDWPGVYRYETFSQEGSGGERFLYVDTTPSGSPYGQLLRLGSGDRTEEVCGSEANWCVVARPFLLRGNSNEDWWLLNEPAAEDLVGETLAQ